MKTSFFTQRIEAIVAELRQMGISAETCQKVVKEAENIKLINEISLTQELINTFFNSK